MINNSKISFNELIHPLDISYVWESIQEAVNNKISYQLLYRLISSEKIEKWVWEQGQGVYDENDELIALEGFIIDISDRKAAEDALRESVERYKLLYHRSPVGIFDYNTDMIITEINDKFAEILGASRDETNGFNLNDFDDKRIIPALLEPLTGNIGFYEGEFKIPNRNKKSIISLRTSPLYAEDYSISGGIGIVEDVSDRIRALKLQEVVYQISIATNTCSDIGELSEQIQKHLGNLIDTTNFFIAFYDKETDTISLPYYVDEEDPDTTFPAGKTMTSYVIKSGKPLLADEEEYKRLMDEGLVELFGVLSKVWLGVPLNIGDENIGAVVVQSYTNPDAYNQDDLKVLQFVSEQIALALKRKHIETLLRNSESKYRTLSNQLPVGVYRTDLSGKVLYANRALADILGYEDISDIECLDLAETGFLENELKNPNNLRASGIATTEKKMKCKDGKEIWVRDIFTPIFDENNEIIYYDGILENVTESKIAQEALRKSQSNLAEAQRISKLGSWILVVDPPKLIWSDEIYRIFGLNRTNFKPTQNDFINLVHEDDRELVENSINEVIKNHINSNSSKNNSQNILNNKSIYNIEHRITRTDGEVLYVHARGEVVYDNNNKQIELMGTLQDITERKRAEQEIKNLNEELENRVEERTHELENAMHELEYENEERKRTQEELSRANERMGKALDREKELSELKTRFMSMISHEYRTPLTVILNSTSIIEKLYQGTREEEFKEFLSKIRISIKGMTSLLEEVLLIGKSEAGKLVYYPSTVSLITFCKNIISEIKLIDKDQHKIDFNTNTDVCVIETDEKLFKQVLNNLLTNAAKYSNRDTTITFELEEQEDKIVITVSDQGIGIVPEDMKHLFDPFHRGKNIGTISGTGLGLAIVKRSLDAMHGSITVESIVGKGTEFTLLLPKKVPEIATKNSSNKAGV